MAQNAGRGRTKPRLLAAIALAGWLGGCIGTPPEARVEPVVSGSWQLSQPRCDQRLSLDDAGSFQLSALARLAGLLHFEAASGQVTLAEAGDSAFSGQFAPDAPLPDLAAEYCVAWNQAVQWLLPLDDAAAALGAHPRSLVFTAQPVSGVGIVWFGSDPATRRDRMALHRTPGGDLAAWRLEDSAFPGGIFRALPSDPLPTALSPLARNANFPDDAILSTLAPGRFGKFLVNLRAAVEVTFSGTCSFALYGDMMFTDPDPARISSLPQVLDFDPGNATAKVVVWEEGTETYHLVPLEVANNGSENCDAKVTARSVSDRLATQFAANPLAVPLFKAPVPPGQSFVAAELDEQPGRLALLPLSGEFKLGAVRITGTMLALPRLIDLGAPGDTLDMLQARDNGTLLLTGSDAQGRWLSAYPGTETTNGLGPFRGVAVAAGPAHPLPFALPMTGEGAADRMAIRIEQPMVAAFWSSGGIRTQGRLLDASGRVLTWSVAGSDDGAGFRIVHPLIPGDYQLDIVAAPGSFTVNAAATPTPAPADAALWDCLTESGAVVGAAPSLWRAFCPRRGVRVLGDLAPFDRLAALDLSDNSLADLTTLPALPSLAALSLAGNPILDIGPLAGRLSLRKLSLARLPLGTASVQVLLGMKDHLRVLDLSGVSTLASGDLETLRNGLPITLIVPPAGVP